MRTIARGLLALALFVVPASAAGPIVVYSVPGAEL